METVVFRDMHFEPFEADGVASTYEELTRAWDQAADSEARREVLERWDSYRRRISTWAALARIRFTQDTRDEAAKAERDRCDRLEPKLVEHMLDFTNHLLDGPHRAEIEENFGQHVANLWEARRKTYSPALEADMIRESELTAEYTALVASAEFEFRGEKHNHSSLQKYADHGDRTLRHDSTVMRWQWFEENAEPLDRIFDELVGLRTSMAQKLGFDHYTQLAYLRMARLDYDEMDVARYRDAVREQVVPLCTEIRRQQAERLGVDPLMYWDELVHDVQGNPRPQGDPTALVARARTMFDEMGSDLGDFFRILDERELMDLEARDGKAGGGYCSGLPHYGVPFIFANFNGTKGDVRVLTHEVGHAFQGYSSRDLFPSDYLWPTAEAAEIHSMSLEFLTWPYMERFFGDDAKRFRQVHLTQALLFLPYGVAVDHFQHEIYSRPNATAGERHEIWQDMERRYLPGVNYGDIARLNGGALWQRQLHIYRYPFYYIDYTLAQVCALQFWVRSETDREKAMADYVTLCRRGGEAPFGEIVKATGLRSPFETGALDEVVSHARRWLSV